MNKVDFDTWNTTLVNFLTEMTDHQRDAHEVFLQIRSDNYDLKLSKLRKLHDKSGSAIVSFCAEYAGLLASYMKECSEEEKKNG